MPISDHVRAKLTGNYLHNFGVDPENNCHEGLTSGPINNVSGAGLRYGRHGAVDRQQPSLCRLFLDRPSRTVHDQPAPSRAGCLGDQRRV